MTPVMKKNLWIASWLLSLLAAFGGGIGCATYFLTGFAASTIFTNELVKAVDTQRLISYLDAEKQKELKESLVTQMDIHVLTLSSLMDYASTDRDRESAKKLLARVAQHRKKYPVVYHEIAKAVSDADEANESNKVNIRIDEILKAYSDEKKENQDGVTQAVR